MIPASIDGLVCPRCGMRLEDAETVCSRCGAPRASAAGQGLSHAAESAPENPTPEQALQDWSRRWPATQPDLPVYTDRERVVLTTVAGGLLAVGAVVGAAVLWGWVFPPTMESSLGWWFVPLVPLSMLGVYWFALVRLRHVEVLRVALEAFPFGVMAVFGLPALVLAGGDALHARGLLTSQLDPYHTGSMHAYVGFGNVAPAAGDYLAALVKVLPQVVLWVVLTAALISALALCCAARFAHWDEVRLGPRPRAPRPEGALLAGSLLAVTLAMGLAGLLDTSGWLILAVLVSGMAAMAATAAWRAYRALQPAIRETTIVYADTTACVVETTYVDGRRIDGAYRLDADGPLSGSSPRA